MAETGKITNRFSARNWTQSPQQLRLRVSLSTLSLNSVYLHSYPAERKTASRWQGTGKREALDFILPPPQWRFRSDKNEVTWPIQEPLRPQTNFTKKKSPEFASAFGLCILHLRTYLAALPTNYSTRQSLIQEWSGRAFWHATWPNCANGVFLFFLFFFFNLESATLQQLVNQSGSLQRWQCFSKNWTVSIQDILDQTHWFSSAGKSLCWRTLAHYARAEFFFFSEFFQIFPFFFKKEKWSSGHQKVGVYFVAKSTS